MRYGTAFVLLGLLVVGCSSMHDRTRMAPKGAARMQSDAAALMQEDAGPGQRLIVRTASMEVNVPELSESVARIEARVVELGGYVSHSNIEGESAHLTVRVPSVGLDGFLDELAALGEEERRAVFGSDITDAYSDAEAEIANLTTLRDRLRKLLERANKVEDVLAVERELNRVQTKLDSITGRLQRMKADLALSEVSIELNQEPAPRILGPLGLLWEGTKWIAIKLFVISP